MPTALLPLIQIRWLLTRARDPSLAHPPLERPRLLHGLLAELALPPLLHRYNYVVHGSTMYIINLGTKESNAVLAEQGLGSLPCGNANCCGRGGSWHTAPERWSTKTSAPLVLINSHGVSLPMVVAHSKCIDCGTCFSHVDPVVLRRLRDVPELLEPLPFDPEWPFSELFLDRALTSNLEYASPRRSTSIHTRRPSPARSLLWVGRQPHPRPERQPHPPHRSSPLLHNHPSRQRPHISRICFPPPARCKGTT